METAGFSVHAEGVEKAFGKTRALKGVSLTCSSGLMHGIIGPEGAGKTTLMRIMLGLLNAQNGHVEYRLDGQAVDFEDVREKVAYMPQRQSLYSELSIDEHLEFFRDLYGIARNEFVEKREELLKITRLADFSNRQAGKLSGGMYKKLGLMCALLRSPKIVFLDEPTNGVDPISRREFWELLYRLADQNILVVMTTSYMDEAERCGRVNLLEEGRIISAGDPKQLLIDAGVSNFDELFLKRGVHV